MSSFQQEQPYDSSYSFYLPVVGMKYTSEYIKDVFENRARIGKVLRVDCIQFICKNTHRPKMKAFVHFSCFYDTRFSMKFRECVSNRVQGENLLYHGKHYLNLYWKVLPFTSTYKNKSPNVDKNMRRVTLSIGSDLTDCISSTNDTKISSVAPIIDNSVNVNVNVNVNIDDENDNNSLSSISLENLSVESCGTNEEISGYYDEYLAHRPPSPLNAPPHECSYTMPRPKLIRSETYYPQETI